MILQGNQRGGAKNLALHLLKDENEHVEVYELRGFISDDLVSAFKEIHALSRGTRAKQFLYSLSLNPPQGENVSTEDFENAIGRVEKKLSLTDQPRAIVFHEKNGRRHCHAVWSRIDGENMKAIPLPFTKYKLRELSRELYIEHGWTMPRGFIDSRERDPRNFTLAQWQQAKRIGKDPRDIKTVFQDCWAISDTQRAFAQALKERGYTLAKGKRGFVALDYRGEVFSISKKWVGIPVKDIRAKLTDLDKLPSVEDTRIRIAKDMTVHLTKLQKRQETAIIARLSAMEEKRVQIAKSHAQARETLRETQTARTQTETKQRQERFNKGLRGLLDRVTGRYHRIKVRNERETVEAQKRDQREKDALIFTQLDERRTLQTRIERLKDLGQTRTQSFTSDIEQYRDMQQGIRDTLEFKERMQSHSTGPERSR